MRNLPRQHVKVGFCFNTHFQNHYPTGIDRTIHVIALRIHDVTEHPIKAPSRSRTHERNMITALEGSRSPILPRIPAITVAQKLAKTSGSVGGQEEILIDFLIIDHSRIKNTNPVTTESRLVFLEAFFV